jgi:alpha-1,3-rhamnosyl/mannosyltransferase
MRVVLNIDAIQPRLTGIGRYALELANGLTAHQAVEQLHFFTHGKFSDGIDKIDNALQQGASAKKVEWARKLPGIFWFRRCRHEIGSWKLRRAIKPLQIDIYHSPNYIIHRADVPSVATLHDFSFIHYPDFHPKDRVKYFMASLPKTIERATHFITDSEFIRQEFIQIFGVAPSQVTAIPLGINEMFRPATANEIQPVLQKYQLEYGRYCLAVSTVEPRKNFKNLLLAFSELPISLQRQYPLVLVGSRGWLSSELHKKIENLQRQGLLKYLGYVPNEDLCHIYAGARAFAYPSYYEGFGFPVLEAMASGVPVLTSNVSSMPEVAGDAAILINPHDIDEITRGLEKLLSDDVFHREASDKGLAIASRYTWQACVDATIAVYQQVIRS